MKMVEMVYLNRIGFKTELHRRESCPDCYKIYNRFENFEEAKEDYLQ